MKDRITKEDLLQHASAGRSIEDVAQFYGKTYRAVYQMCVKKQVALAGFKPRPRKGKEVIMITGSPIEVKVPVAEKAVEVSVAVKTSTRLRPCPRFFVAFFRWWKQENFIFYPMDRQLKRNDRD